MVGGLVGIVIINAVVFSFIFWVLTFLAKALYTNQYYNYKLNFYECGFKNLTTTRVNYNLNYILLILFLLVYDGEFLILIPVALNLSLLSVEVILAVSFFVVWLLVALFFDLAYSALDWNVR